MGEPSPFSPAGEGRALPGHVSSPLQGGVSSLALRFLPLWEGGPPLHPHMVAAASQAWRTRHQPQNSHTGELRSLELLSEKSRSEHVLFLQGSGARNVELKPTAQPSSLYWTVFVPQLYTALPYLAHSSTPCPCSQFSLREQNKHTRTVILQRRAAWGIWAQILFG